MQHYIGDPDHMGMERKPWTSDTMGERMRVRGTDNSEDIATVWEITDMAATGHNNQAGILELGNISIYLQ